MTAAVGAPPELRLRFQPKQGRLLDLVENRQGPVVIGYGGSRGGGKSGGLRRVMLQRRFDHPATDGWIVRRTFPQIKKNHIDPMWREFPQLESGYRAGDRVLELPNGSRILFIYAETIADVRELIGPECMDLMVDQAEQFTEIELETLRSCVRWPGTPLGACKALYAFNPGGRGASYLARVFVRHEYKGVERASDYDCVHARGWDNVEWVREYLGGIGVSEGDYYLRLTEPERRECFILHSDYGRYLNSLSVSLRAAWLEGSFDRFAGQYFDFWDPARNVRRYEALGVEKWHTRWISIDWGYAHNAAVYWHAQTATHIATYQEYVRHRMGQRALAQEIVDRSAGQTISAVYLSPDAFAKRGTEASVAEQIGDVLQDKGLPRPIPADNDRVGGWNLMHDLLGWPACAEEGRAEQAPGWVIAANCERLIESIPLATRDERRIEDVEKFDSTEDGRGGDDALDAARYGLKSRQAVGERPREEVVRARVLQIADPMGRYLAILAEQERQMSERRCVRMR